MFNETKVLLVNWLKWHNKLQHLFCGALYNQSKWKKCAVPVTFNYTCKYKSRLKFDWNKLVCQFRRKNLFLFPQTVKVSVNFLNESNPKYVTKLWGQSCLMTPTKTFPNFWPNSAKCYKSFFRIVCSFEYRLQLITQKGYIVLQKVL